MPSVYDVPADLLIPRLTRYLKENVSSVKPPPWARFVKTGAHAMRQPDQPDWWYTRCASVLRKIYLEGPIGISRLRLEYGGRTGKGTVPEHFRRGSGAVVRETVQQLEAANLVRTVEKKGRVITVEGRGLLDSLAGDVKRELEKAAPELKRY